MRYFLIVLCLFLSNLTSAQSSWHTTLKWELGGSAEVTNRLEGGAFQQMGLWQYCQTRALPTTYASYAITFSDISTMPESVKGLAPEVREKIGINPKATLEISRHNGQARAVMCLYPYLKRGNQIYRLASFTAQVIPAAANREAESAFRQKSNTTFKNTSVLANGDWHKLAVTEDGMYKITPAYLSENQIVNSAVAINALRIVGNHTGILPSANNADRPDDLLEVPLFRFDANQDGLFNGNDYILFFARSAHQWQYDDTESRYRHRYNPYRDQNYLFLSVNAGPGIGPNPQSFSGAANTTVSVFDDYDFVEDDRFNLIGGGRNWFGDNFDFDLSFNYGFDFPDVVTTANAQIEIRAVGRASTANTVLNATYLGNNFASLSFPRQDGGDYPDFAERVTQRGTFLPQGNNITINLTYDNSANPSGVAWLDYLTIQVRRSLRYRSKDLIFRDQSSVGSGNVVEYRIAGAPSDLKVWDVTNANQVEEMRLTVVNQVATFVNVASELREYVAFSGSDFISPKYIESIENQNLHNLSTPEMIVISHANFADEAERLAQFHLDQDGMSVEVVDIEAVYNEFSSGGKDVTAIRDFTRMLYTRGNTTLKYLLLFGDGSYDFKGILGTESDFIPTWQSSFSLNLESSDITDDYYGYMDPDEGGQLLGKFMDIGIGRIPCENLTQARNYVDKMMHYAQSSAAFGDWRNKIILTIDDRDKGWEDIFVRGSETLEQKALQSSGAYNFDKIYSDAYTQITSTGTQLYPEATRDIFRKVQRGALITNYIGHGGEIGLSSEKLLTLNEVNNWSNYDAQSVFITVTCEFTRFDDPKRVSAGEQLLLNPNGGAIALLSTTRVVGAGAAVSLNEALFDTLLARPQGRGQTFGDILKAAKNSNRIIGGDTKLKFSLFGDPALRLALPYFGVKTTSVNGQSLNQIRTDTLKALDQVELTGEVVDADGNRLSDFNGVISVSVFDKSITRQTKVNDGVGNPLPFQAQDNLIHRGQAKVENGQFTTQFIVPLDISFQFGLGKVSYYAQANERDAAGFYDRIVIGGLNPDARQDEAGPEINLFMNDESFVPGGITGPDPEIFARLQDSSGINIMGTGIGHDLVAILDENTRESLVLNDFYQSDLDDFRSGSVRFPLFDLEEGPHTLTLRAFDVLNNFSESTTNFIVADNAEMALRRVLNYPNPFTTHTDFQFEHNRAGQPLDIQVQIFTVSGKLIKTLQTSIVATGNRVSGLLSWDGLDQYGDKIGKGQYIYRLKVRSQIDNSTADQYETLVILR